MTDTNIIDNAISDLEAIVHDKDNHHIPLAVFIRLMDIADELRWYRRDVIERCT